MIWFKNYALFRKIYSIISSFPIRIYTGDEHDFIYAVSFHDVIENTFDRIDWFYVDTVDIKNNKSVANTGSLEFSGFDTDNLNSRTDI